MSLTARITFWALVAAPPVLAVLLLDMPGRGPVALLVVGLAPVAVLLARRSIAYPLALSGIPTLIIALRGTDPFPHGLVTIAFAGWVGLAIVLALYFGELRLPLGLLLAPPILGSIVLGIVMLSRLPASSTPSYASTKVQLFVLENLLLLLAGVLVGQLRGHVERFLVISMFMAGLSGMLLLWRLANGQAQTAYDNRYTISALENPISLGRESGDGLMIALYLVLVGAAGLPRRAAMALFPLLALALLASGSRGPVLGTLVGVAIVILLLARSESVRRNVFRVTGLAIVTTVLIVEIVPGASLQRSLSVLTGSGSGLSSNGRFQLWQLAWNQFLAHPVLGIGTGSFASVLPPNFYPHNLVLETGAELGFFGLVPLTIFLVSSTRLLANARRDPGTRAQAVIVTALFAAALVNAMFSGDVTTNAGVWLTAGLGIGLAYRAQAAPADDAAPVTAGPVARRAPLGGAPAG